MNSGSKKYRLAGKKPSHRKALIKSQLLELLRSGKVKTTPSRARILCAEAEVVIGLAKRGDQSALNRLQQLLPTERSVNLLLKLAPAWAGRSSGYTTTAKALPRKGDNADQMYVMLLDVELGKAKKSVIQETLAKQRSKSKKVK